VADTVDLAQEQIERDEDARKPKPYTLAPGVPGDCELCGEWSGRLVDGACAPCRDRYARLRL
jgi:hypothetical protein